MKFSVLMPVYFKEEPDYLDKSLNSILREQSIIPDEVVIVEDGPLTEELYRILQEYENEFTEIIKRVPLAVNNGMGVAMQKGIENSKFDWIARMDSDDIAVFDRFETQLNFILRNPQVNVLGGSIEEFDTVVGDLKRARKLPEFHNQIISMMKRRNPINHMTVFFNKKVAIDAGGYWNRRYFEDYNLWYDMSKVGAIFHNLPEILVYARVGNSMIARRSGLSYFKLEKVLLKKFLNDRFISIFQYIWLYIAKYLLRILPHPALSFFYKIFLRSKVE